MSESLRKLCAVLTGVIVSLLVVSGIESIGHIVYPPPGVMDLSDSVMLRKYVSTLPVGAFVFVLVAWVFGTVLGGMVACVIARKRPRVYSRIIGGVMLLLSTMNMLYIPHPLWFSVIAVALILAATVWVGSLNRWWGK